MPRARHPVVQLAASDQGGGLYTALGFEPYAREMLRR